MLGVHPLLVISLLRTDEIVAQIKEFLEAFATKDILILFSLDSKDCITSSDVFDE